VRATSPRHHDILRRVWLFSGLEAKELAQLGGLAVVRRYRPRETVVTQGDDSGDLFVVLSGRLKVTWNDAEGGEVLLSILEAGDVFGEIALLDDRPRSASVTAMEGGELLVVERRGFRALLVSVPTLAVNLLLVMARRMRNLSDRTQNMSLLNVECRLAKAILGLAERFGKEERRGEILLTLKLSQQELANMVGATRELVNRRLRGWQDQGIIELAKGRVVIRDAAALEAVSQAP
jgi:CRP/FNR family transcriptional regulator, cyclic AMP receptor protein